MLDVTTNQNLNYGGVAGGSGGLDDELDPLFDNDWLHEHNLDVLFDLFEEEVERKGSLDGPSSQHANSSTLFGSSPITSYLFGTSPSLASALDLCDLLYFDNQQQPIQPQQHQQNHSNTQTENNSTTANNQATHKAEATSTSTYNIFNQGNARQQFINSTTTTTTTNHTANSITNAMRIKKKLKRGKSEGVSLLARPLTSNNNVCGQDANNNVTNNNNNSNVIINKPWGNNINFNILDKSHSDKTSANKFNNLKKSIIAGSNNRTTSMSVDIDYSKKTNLHQQHNRNKQHHYQHNHHHHKHNITGQAVIREHAYAVRGH